MTTRTLERLDTSILEQLLTDPDLHADHLPGETGEELLARRTAAADITDQIIAASIHRDGIDHIADLDRRQVEVMAAEAAADVARWLDEIQGATS